MGRPLNHRYFGDNNIGSSSAETGGEGIASITLGAANNSSGYSAGAANISIAVPAIAGGRRATAALVVGPAGAFLTAAAGTSGTDVNTFTYSGTGASTTTTVWTGVVQKSGGTTTGTGAVFTVTRTASTTTYSGNTTVTVTTKGAGYAAADTIKIDGALIGGVTTTNDLTITVVGTTAAAGTITGITITDAGAGYDAVPAVTLSTGTQGTLTVTAVRTAGTAARDNAIICSSYIPASGTAGFISGSSGAGLRTKSDIIRQVGSRSYVVQNSDGIGRCTLKSTLASTYGEMNIIATDYTGTGYYYVTKLTNRKAYITQGTGSGHEFASGSVVPWTFGTAVTGVSVVITNA
jgi:hypothetical protein